MEAQIFDLARAGITACLVGSAQPDMQILSRIKKGEFNLVYCSPEYLLGGRGQDLLNILKKRLIMVAIDGKCKIVESQKYVLLPMAI